MSHLRSTLPRARRALLGVPAVMAALAAPAAATAGAPRSPLERATGYTASQLQPRRACGPIRPGQFRCLAQVLTVRGSGRTARPLHVPHMRILPPAAVAAAAPGQYTAPYLQWAYDTSWLSANNGAGDTVAIVDAYGDPTAYSDMEQFRNANGLPSQPLCSGSVTTSCFEVVNQSGRTSPLPSSSNDETGSWNIEESLDIDAVSSICPLCRILVVEANSDDSDNLPDLETAVSSAARLGANQISLSWGTDTTPDATGNSWPFTSITSAAILAAAGDDSYPGPYVGYPAALPNVTAVGGTALSSSASAARGFSESAWAKQICTGGSTCGTESGCDSTQSQPAYQSGVTTNCTGRAYNDVSADGDPNTGLEIYDSQPGTEGCGTANNWCIVGGTSLSAPLVAAFEAVAGITDSTPAWSYTNASLLNDITSGSDGTCPSGQTVICTAGLGWDGPTGNGSISGDLATGGPGIGGSTATGVNANDVTLAGGVYPNGASTSSHWSYWVNGNSSTTQATATSTSSGAGAQRVSATLCALTPSTTYDYQLLATNSLGTESGYQGSFTTAATEAAPTATTPPAISGSPIAGGTLSGQDAGWNDQSCNTSPSYQWQESSSLSGSTWTAVGTGPNYTLTPSDLGQYLRFAETESNGAGATTSTSAVVGPVTAPAAAPTSTRATPTPTTSTTTTSSTTTVVRFYRCARACVLINTHGAATYQPQRADWGKYIKAVTTTTRTANNITTTTRTTRWIGPVSSSRAGAISLTGSAHAASTLSVRGSTHRLLAQVRIAKRSGKRLTLAISRQGHAATEVWAYVVKQGAVISCTAVHVLRPSSSLSVALKAGQTLKLVAVQT